MAILVVHGTNSFAGSNPNTGTHGRIDGGAGTTARLGEARLTVGSIERDSDSPGTLSIGTTSDTNHIDIGTGGAFTGDITLGSSSVSVEVPGDLNITGDLDASGNLTVTGNLVTLNATNIAFKDNLIQLNGGAGGAGYDAGLLVERHSSDVQADTLAARTISLDSQESLAAGNTEVKLGTEASSSDDAYNSAMVTIHHGPLSGQSREITDYEGSSRIATLDSAWTASAITGTVSSSSSTTITGTGTYFLGELQPGDRILLDSGGSAQVRIVDTITDDSTLDVTSAVTGTLTNVSVDVTAPGGDASTTIPASLASSFFAGLFWDESADQMVVASTRSDPGAGAVVIESYLPFQAKLAAYHEIPHPIVPASITDTGQVFTRKFGGTTELYYMDDFGSETQITTNGAINLNVDLQVAYDNGGVLSVHPTTPVDLINAQTDTAALRVNATGTNMSSRALGS